MVFETLFSLVGHLVCFGIHHLNYFIREANNIGLDITGDLWNILSLLLYKGGLPVLFLIFEAERDLYQKNKGISTNHRLGAVIRGIFGLAVYGSPEFPIYLSLWWIFFDLYFNYISNQPLLYVGKTADLDKLLHKIPFNPLVVKITALIISVVIYSVIK